MKFSDKSYSLKFLVGIYICTFCKKHLVKFAIPKPPRKTPRQTQPPLCPLGGRQNLDDFRGFSMRRSDPMVTKGGPGRRERAPRRGPALKVVELLPGGGGDECVVNSK